jgi:hypothetical protein
MQDPELKTRKALKSALGFLKVFAAYRVAENGTEGFPRVKRHYPDGMKRIARISAKQAPLETPAVSQWPPAASPSRRKSLQVSSIFQADLIFNSGRIVATKSDETGLSQETGSRHPPS